MAQLLFYHNITFHVPPHKSLSCFILKRLGSTSQHVTFVKGMVLLRCNSRLFNYKFSPNDVAFKLNDLNFVRLDI